MKIITAAAVLTLVGALGACSTEEEMRAVDSAADETSATTDTTGSAQAPVPVPDGEVRTRGLVTVIDAGDGVQMCLGAIAESNPPQCGGPALVDFDWGASGSQEAAGTRWGSYALRGTFDGTAFTVAEAIPAALYEGGLQPEPTPLGAACESPTTTDTAKATPQDLDATLAAASALPTYASAWLTGNTINVAVTEDAAGAEAALRQTWGGMLCVTVVEQTDADLTEINTELQTALGDRLLTSGSFAPDSLDAQVVYDDGSIQAWADQAWGEGLVKVTSAIEPTD